MDVENKTMHISKLVDETAQYIQNDYDSYLNIFDALSGNNIKLKEVVR